MEEEIQHVKNKIEFHRDTIKLLEQDIVIIKNKYCAHSDITMCQRLDYNHCNLCGLNLTNHQLDDIKPKITYRMFQ